MPQRATKTRGYSGKKNDEDEGACFVVKLVVGRELYITDIGKRNASF